MSDRRSATGHEWTEAVAIQTFVRDLEVRAMAAYMTHPRCFPALKRIFEGALQSFAGLTPPASYCKTDDNCPAGWSCCDGICQHGCEPRIKPQDC